MKCGSIPEVSDDHNVVGPSVTRLGTLRASTLRGRLTPEVSNLAESSESESSHGDSVQDADDEETPVSEATGTSCDTFAEADVNAEDDASDAVEAALTKTQASDISAAELGRLLMDSDFAHNVLPGHLTIEELSAAILLAGQQRSTCQEEMTPKQLPHCSAISQGPQDMMISTEAAVPAASTSSSFEASCQLIQRPTTRTATHADGGVTFPADKTIPVTANKNEQGQSAGTRVEGKTALVSSSSEREDSHADVPHNGGDTSIFHDNVVTLYKPSSEASSNLTEVVPAERAQLLPHYSAPIAPTVIKDQTSNNVHQGAAHMYNVEFKDEYPNDDLRRTWDSQSASLVQQAKDRRRAAHRSETFKSRIPRLDSDDDLPPPLRFDDADDSSDEAIINPPDLSQYVQYGSDYRMPTSSASLSHARYAMWERDAPYHDDHDDDILEHQSYPMTCPSCASGSSNIGVPVGSCVCMTLNDGPAYHAPSRRPRHGEVSQRQRHVNQPVSTAVLPSAATSAPRSPEENDAHITKAPRQEEYRLTAIFDPSSCDSRMQTHHDDGTLAPRALQLHSSDLPQRPSRAQDVLDVKEFQQCSSGYWDKQFQHDSVRQETADCNNIRHLPTSIPAARNQGRERIPLTAVNDYRTTRRSSETQSALDTADEAYHLRRTAEEMMGKSGTTARAIGTRRQNHRMISQMQGVTMARRDSRTSLHSERVPVSITGLRPRDNGQRRRRYV